MPEYHFKHKGRVKKGWAMELVLALYTLYIIVIQGMTQSQR
jgi:hypothetical protein